MKYLPLLALILVAPTALAAPTPECTACVNTYCQAEIAECNNPQDNVSGLPGGCPAIAACIHLTDSNPVATCGYWTQLDCFCGSAPLHSQPQSCIDGYGNGECRGVIEQQTECDQSSTTGQCVLSQFMDYESPWGDYWFLSYCTRGNCMIECGIEML